MKKRLTLIKIGGNVLDDEAQLDQFLSDFARVEGHKILVHGGGKTATKLAADLNHQAVLVDGRRITDQKTLDIVTMVYAGLINKSLVAKLQQRACNAVGLSGADGNFIQAVKRPVNEIDYGFVGDIHDQSVNAAGIEAFLNAGFVPIFSAITHDRQGQLLNTNADTIAGSLAVALSEGFETRLVYCFEKKGVLADVNDDQSLVREIREAEFLPLQQSGVVAGGMIPKLYNAFQAINKGVKEVIIGQASDLSRMDAGEFGTKIMK
jgi:acetylglutamate kinase